MDSLSINRSRRKTRFLTAIIERIPDAANTRIAIASYRRNQPILAACRTEVFS